MITNIRKFKHIVIDFFFQKKKVIDFLTIGVGVVPKLKNNWLLTSFEFAQASFFGITSLDTLNK